MGTYNRTIQADGTINFHQCSLAFPGSENYAGQACQLAFVDDNLGVGFDVLINGRYVGFAEKQ